MTHQEAGKCGCGLDCGCVRACGWVSKQPLPSLPSTQFMIFFQWIGEAGTLTSFIPSPYPSGQALHFLPSFLSLCIFLLIYLFSVCWSSPVRDRGQSKKGQSCFLGLFVFFSLANCMWLPVLGFRNVQTLSLSDYVYHYELFSLFCSFLNPKFRVNTFCCSVVCLKSIQFDLGQGVNH